MSIHAGDYDIHHGGEGGSRLAALPQGDADGPGRSGASREPAASPQRHALQLDIANFFNRIHRPTLFRLLQHRLVRAVRRQGLSPDEARALQAQCRALLAGNPAEGARRKGPAAGFARVPPHKRLSGQETGRGLPIGNLTSQFFANVYLNELDQFVKHTLKARWYVRYVDDFVLLSDDPAQLLAWREAIETFLAERLHLQLKARNEPRPVADGVDFLGYIVRPGYRLPRRRVVHRFWRALAGFERDHVRANALRLPSAARDLLRARLASYRAHLSHANSHWLWQRTLQRFAWLNVLFDFGHGDAFAQPPRPRWQPTRISGLTSQIRHFAHDYPAACVLVEVGNRWRFVASGAAVGSEAFSRLAALLQGDADGPGRSGASREPAPDKALRSLGGTSGRGRSGASREARPDQARCAALPAVFAEIRSAALPALRRRLKRAGIPHVLVVQEGHLRTGFKRRVLRLVWYPLAASTQAGAPAGAPQGANSEANQSPIRGSRRSCPNLRPTPVGAPQGANAEVEQPPVRGSRRSCPHNPSDSPTPSPIFPPFPRGRS